MREGVKIGGRERGRGRGRREEGLTLTRSCSCVKQRRQYVQK